MDWDEMAFLVIGGLAPWAIAGFLVFYLRLRIRAWVGAWAAAIAAVDSLLLAAIAGGFWHQFKDNLLWADATLLLAASMTSSLALCLFCVLSGLAEKLRHR